MANLSLNVLGQIFEHLVRFLFFALASTASRALLRFLLIGTSGSFILRLTTGR